MDVLRIGGARPAVRGGGDRARMVAYGQLALAMATVGASAVLGKRMVEEIPVGIGSAVRFGLASLILVPLLARSAAGGRWPERRDRATLFLQAVCGVFGFALCWLYGLRLTSAGEGGIVASTAPGVIALASYLLLGERPTRAGMIGAALAIGGVAAMTLAGEVGGVAAERGPNPMLGNGLILLATVGEALFFVLGKRAGVRLSPLAIATWVTGYGFVSFVPLALLEAPGFDPGGVSAGAWWAVVLYAVGPTVVGYLLAYRSLATLPASAAGIFAEIVPLTAVALGAIVLGEPVGWTHALGVGVRR